MLRVVVTPGDSPGAKKRQWGSGLSRDHETTKSGKRERAATLATFAFRISSFRDKLLVSAANRVAWLVRSGDWRELSELLHC